MRWHVARWMRSLLIAVTAVASIARPAAQGPLRLTATIELPRVEGRIDHLAFDMTTQRLFIAALGNNTVEVVDLKTNSFETALTGFREPQGIAVAADSEAVAVANGDGNGVQLLDVNDFHVIRSVPLGDDSDNIRYDPIGQLLYVGYGSGALAAIRARDGAVVGTIRLPAHPESFQVERQGSRMFVNVPDAHRIDAIDRTTLKIVSMWRVQAAGDNFPMALDEANHRLFIGCRRPAKVLVYDTEDGRVTSSFDIVGDTDDLFYDAARKRVYVSGGEGYLDAFQQAGSSFSRIAHLQTPSGARTSLFVADLNRLYLAVPHRGQQRAEIRVYEVD